MRSAPLHVLVFLLALNLPSTVHAYCAWGSQGWGALVPVRLHEDLHYQMLHNDGTTWTRAELEHTVRITIARLNASAGANAPFLYLDTNPSSCVWFDSDCNGNPDLGTNCRISNAINVVPTNCGTTYWLGATPSLGHIVQVQTSFSMLGFKRWDQFSSTQPSVPSLDFLHEFGHAIGLGHPEDCSNWSTICPVDTVEPITWSSAPCAVMTAGFSAQRSQEYFMPDDQAGLRVNYGPRIPPSERQFESADLSSSIYEIGLSNVDAQAFFDASSYPNARTSVTLVGYRRTTSYVPAPTVFSWDWATLAVTSLGNPSGHYANGPLGAAQSSTHRVVASSTYRLTSDQRRWTRRISSSSRLVGGSTWTLSQSNPSEGSIGDTRASGMSVAYDPQRALFHYAFRRTNGEVLLQASTSGAPYATGHFAEGTPSIACAPVAGRNCIAVSVEPGREHALTGSLSTQPRLRWFRFSHNGVSFDPGPIWTEPWIMGAGDPQVDVYYNGSSYEHVVTYRWPVNTITEIYLLRKPASDDSGFAYWGQLTTSYTVTSAAGGSTRDLEIFLFSQ